QQLLSQSLPGRLIAWLPFKWKIADLSPFGEKRQLAQSCGQYPLVVLGLFWRAERATSRIVNKHSPRRTNFDHDVADSTDH
ncbi:MAG TPA: hypothetical protein VFD87_20755, partial [Phototrophicaceae bacterium]|nr:hypothetical protein [Phototrophicaceae bacterium]